MSAKDELSPQFKTILPLTLIDKKRLAKIFGDDNGWALFYKSFPKAHEITSLSRIGFNDSRTEALVETGHSKGSLAGAGFIWYLIREEGKWLIKENVLTWVS